jgi:hypothetical protein
MLPVFLEKVARCEVRGETMHFIWDELDLAIPVSICIANMRQCSEALAKWQVAQLDCVVPISAANH